LPRSGWRRAPIRRDEWRHIGASDATRVINDSYQNGRRGKFMADPNDKRNQTQSSGQQGGQQAGQQSGQQSGQQGGQQRQSNQPSGQQPGAMQARGQGPRGGGMARRGGVPAILALSPSDVFGLSPFDLIRSFTDELDRAFGGLGLTRGLGPGE